MTAIVSLSARRMIALPWGPKMRRVLGVVNHSFGWSGLGVEHTTSAFGGPGKQHETAKEKTCRRQSQSRRLGSQMLPSRDEKGTERGDAAKDQQKSDDEHRVPTGTGPLTGHACGLPSTRDGESRSTRRRLLRNRGMLGKPLLLDCPHSPVHDHEQHGACDVSQDRNQRGYDGDAVVAGGHGRQADDGRDHARSQQRPWRRLSCHS